MAGGRGVKSGGVEGGFTMKASVNVGERRCVEGDKRAGLVHLTKRKFGAPVRRGNHEKAEK